MANKTDFIILRVTPEEKLQIKERAERADMSVSQFITAAVFNKKVADRKPLLELVREINYIGNNINQATKIMNTYHGFDGADFDYLVKEFTKLKQIVCAFIEDEI